VRISVQGDADSAKAVRGYLRNAGVLVKDSFPGYTVRIETSSKNKEIICDSVPSELETNILFILHEYLTDLPEKHDVVLRRAGGDVRGDREIKFILPAFDEPQCCAAERAIYLGVLRTIRWGETGEKKSFFDRVKRAFLPVAFFALLATGHAAPPIEYNIALDPVPGWMARASTFFPQIQFPAGGITVIQPNGTLLHITCDAGCGGAATFADNTAFTAGTTAVNITAGWYSVAPTNCSTGNACAPQLTIDRKLFVQSFQGTNPWVVSASGGSFAVTGTFFQATQPVSCAAAATCPVNASQVGGPWTQNLTQWNSVALGSPSAYGTSPGAVNVPGVNAFVTNTVPVTGTFFQATQPVSCTAANCAVNVAQWSGSSLGAMANYGTSPGAVLVPGVNAFVTNTVPVTGTFFQATQPVSCSAAATCPVNASQVGGPWTQNLTQWNGVALGSPSAYGTSPGAVNVPGVNAFITNAVPVTGNFFQATQPINGTVTTVPANPSQPQAVNILNNPLNPIAVKNQTPVYVMQLSNGVLVPVYLVEGQAPMSQSIPVAIASNQTALPVTVPPAAGIGADSQTHTLATDGGGNQFVTPLGLPLQPCNAVRTRNCQHF
jgi:hypothetical protein